MPGDQNLVENLIFMISLTGTECDECKTMDLTSRFSLYSSVQASLIVAVGGSTGLSHAVTGTAFHCQWAQQLSPS